MTVDERTVVVWPDGAWCELAEAESFGAGRSDDVREVRVPIDMPDDAIDDVASMASEGASDEEIAEQVSWWLGG